MEIFHIIIPNQRMFDRIRKGFQKPVMKDGSSYALGAPNDVFISEIIEIAFDCPVHIMRHPHRPCPLIVATGRENSCKNVP